jgi:hypothetical protein
MSRFTVSILYGKKYDKIEAVMFYDCSADCEDHLKKLASRKINAVAKNPSGQIIGRSLEDDGTFLYWIEH